MWALIIGYDLKSPGGPSHEFGNSPSGPHMKKPTLMVGLTFSCVDFDFVFLNQIRKELEYLVWVLKGEYEENLV